FLVIYLITFINVSNNYKIDSILQRFDDLDMKILSELTKDASISIPQLSKKLNINSSVLYSRIKRLTKRELIRKFTVVINESQLGINIKATVGINRDPKLKEPIHNELIKIPEIRSLIEVTGRFDIILSVNTRTLEELHKVVIERIGKIEGIQATETFVEMQRTDKEPVYSIQTSNQNFG
ncbi:MAG TPA: Lrp/AsnC family transcriptional regulator, partial [Candidatus Nitrosocosmicus sp.]|nr:Lrp/AsnC family transcriptional regulator [Candidatus Nitrosocosmicus sp.]